MNTNLKQLLRSARSDRMLGASALLLLATTSASAQDLSSLAAQNMAFDQMMQNQVAGAMYQNQMAQQQLLQSYIQQNGSRLQQEYQQYLRSGGMPISFQQFAYYHLATAGGTNPGPALEQQRRSFAASQEANRTVQQGFDSYNQGYWNNQQTNAQIFNRYSNEAIMGNAPYVNPETGERYNLPYGAANQGGYTTGGNAIASDPYGNYRQVDPLGYSQDLEVDDE